MKLVYSFCTALSYQIVVTTAFSFTLPKSKEEKELEKDIKDIFLSGGGLSARLGGNTQEYSGSVPAPLDANEEVLLELIQGSTSIGDSPAPADYNLNSVSHAFVEKNTAFENCADYAGYECVPYYQCANGSIITDGAGIIDIRNGFAALNPEESKCPGFLDVCCKDPDYVPPPPHPKYVSKCGKRNNNGLGARIQGFTEGESQFGEWPAMCAVLSGETDQKQFECGASLIDTNVLLTAAHCVKKFEAIGKTGDKFPENRLFVRCGEWDTQHNTEPYAHQELEVKQVIIHPEFNARNLANDFAVLMTTIGQLDNIRNNHFVPDFNVDTICLPKPGENFDGRTCFATGWGKDKFGGDGNYQVVLKELEIPTVDSNTCQNSLRTTRLGSRFRLHPSFMCAGGVPGKDTCQGDGGGPLMCSSYEDPDTYHQAGIVAWGIGCGGSTPGVYAAVSEAVCWIDMVTTCLDDNPSQSSHFEFLASECGSWVSDTKRRLQALPARIRTVLEGAYAFDECPVIYEDSTYLDLSDFARIANKTG